MTDAVMVELIRDASVLLGGVAATMGVAWISARGPKKILEKVAEIHILTNNTATEQRAQIASLIAEVSGLKSAAAWTDGFKAGKQDAEQK